MRGLACALDCAHQCIQVRTCISKWRQGRTQDGGSKALERLKALHGTCQHTLEGCHHLLGLQTGHVLLTSASAHQLVHFGGRSPPPHGPANNVFKALDRQNDAKGAYSWVLGNKWGGMAH
eukprot:1161601-Pelagomonas_calceolata.AAC.20